MNPEILEILACPKCTGSLCLTQKNDGLSCSACHLIYPIIESVPLLLPEEGITEQEWEQGVRNKKSKNADAAQIHTPDYDSIPN